MFHKTIALLLALILLFTGGHGAAGSAQAAERCTAERGQTLINEGRYERASREFTCVIDAEPTGVEGYRGRIEAELLLGRFSDAVRDYARVTALVLPVHPDAQESILAGYTARLKASPDNIPALTGASFARWWFFEYAQAIHLLNRLVDLRPNDVYGNLFRGSSRLLLGATKAKGIADLEKAISLAPRSADMRFVVADAYTYGLSDPQRALAEATLALQWGLDTPRIQAILAVAQMALGNQQAAAAHTQKHIKLVTTELLTTDPLAAGTSLSLALLPGRSYEIPLAAVTGETLSILTSSPDFYDTILVLLAPDGTPVLGADDYDDYFAGFQWVAPVTGNYRMLVTSFESVNTGTLVVTRN